MNQIYNKKLFELSLYYMIEKNKFFACWTKEFCSQLKKGAAKYDMRDIHQFKLFIINLVVNNLSFHCIQSHEIEIKGRIIFKFEN